MINRRKFERVKEPFTIKEEVYRRFPVTKQAFVKVGYEDTGKLGVNLFADKMMKNQMKRMQSGDRGRDQRAVARDLGANTFNLLTGQYGVPNTGLLSWKPLVVPPPLAHHTVQFSPETLTEMVKDNAALYGADLVGIAALEERWVYEQDVEKPYRFADVAEPEETEEAFLLPHTMTRAVVMAFTMDADLLERSSSVDADTAASLGYSRMGIAAISLAESIRALGYKAVPAMNDTALSIPLAIQAGLGELGRMGLLITPEYGPAVRLAKVLTDMPLNTDHPITFGVERFCLDCHLCADHCPSGSIGKGEPTFETSCDHNNPGIKKWTIEAEKCLRFWQQNGASCGTCIAVCPFTRGFVSEQCLECNTCNFDVTCSLIDNTVLRQQEGYLKSEYWGNPSEVIYRRRKGL